jgi:3-deoxy-manno-octulosonate cytidylyltransferase (CMP-KDO synthetase)
LGIRVAMTRSDHPSGTDRIAEVAASHDADIVVNVQGDEPLIEPATIDAAIRPLLDHPEIPMATVCHRITDRRDIEDPNVVKVVCDHRGRAIYFSRCPIPYARAGVEDAVYRQHVGLYVFRRAFLLEYAKMRPTPLEQAEKLEQLRVLESGYPIAVVETAFQSIGVDTPSDLERVRVLVERALDVPSTGGGT